MTNGSGTTFVLRAAQVLNVSGGFDGPLDVAVRDGWIEAVGANLRSADAQEVDSSGLWLMPGVFDCHDHIAISTTDAMEAMRTPITQWSLEAAQNMRRTLEGGVTFVRDAAGADAGLRNAVRNGYVPGPELQLSVVAVSQTGGHVDGFLPGPGFEISADYVMPDFPGRPPYLADGVEDMRRVVRQILRAGADWIKLCTTGGLLSPHDDPEGPEFSLEEIEVAVGEAARRGKGVMVHAFGGEGLDLSVQAGVRSVEHGIFLTESQAVEMASRGTYLVPTLAVFDDVVAWARRGVLPEYANAKALAIEDELGRCVSIAKENGVPIAVGSDFISREEHGSNLREIALLHRAGLTPEEALLAATANGAELCGVAGSLGRIAPGFRFDAIVLDRDPSDMSVFEEPRQPLAVFQAGRAVKPWDRFGDTAE